MTRGVFAGFQQLLFNRTPHFVVTPKNPENQKNVLSVTNLAPLHVILVILGGAFWIPLIWKDPEQMGIALYMFACAVISCLVITIIVCMHFWENGPASIKNTLAHGAMWTICIGGVVGTAVLERRVIFNAAAANLFVPVFPYEWIVMSVFYGIAMIHILLSAFVL